MKKAFNPMTIRHLPIIQGSSAVLVGKKAEFVGTSPESSCFQHNGFAALRVATGLI